MHKYGLLFVCILIVLFVSCESEIKEFVPDVSDIEIESKVVRFDQLLTQLDTNNLEIEIQKLKSDYPKFTSLYFSRILPFEGKTNEQFLSNLNGYLTDSRIKNLQDTVALVFENIEQGSLPELMQSMKYMKYYFHDFVPPNIYTFSSEFTFQKFIFQDEDKDGLGIGLDMFLGNDYNYKAIDPNNPAFSQYLTRTFSKEYIAKMMMEILIDDRLGKVPGSRLLDHMIHNGKKLYVLEKVLPTTPDSIVFEYTADQTNWVKSNELEMWAFFFDQNLFYESNSMKINKYINPSPTSPGMPAEAPGRTANYIGWKIVKAYMKKHPDLTIQELLDNKDSQQIMDRSRYKPKRK